MKSQRASGLWSIVVGAVVAMAWLPVAHADPVVYTVTDFTDEDGTCPDDTMCTLRTAITTANATPGAHIAVAPTTPGVPWTITLTEELPAITAATILDGTGLPNSTGASPGTIIDGSGLVGASGALSDGFHVASGGGTTISGFIIVNFSGDGILIDDSTGGDQVSGNYIGVGADGMTAAPNAVGVVISGSPGNVIGSPASPSALTSITTSANVISGNTGAGLSIQGASSTGNHVIGNVFGADKSGKTAVANSDGILVETGAATTSILANLVSGNSGDGIHLVGAGTGNVINLDLIGVAIDGTTALGNGAAGVYVDATSSTTIGEASDAAGSGNIIADNAKGVVVKGGTSNANVIEYNQMSGNGIGIDLGDNGVTANDAGDVDTGPNGLQNYPALTGVWNDGGTIVVSGSLDTTAGAYDMQFFANAACSTTMHGEGATFLQDVSQNPGSFQIRLDVNTINTPVAFVAATATGTSGTSEFSICQAVQTCPSIDLEPFTLPTVVEETAYSAKITATGTAGATYTYSVTSGSLPSGLTLTAFDATTGLLSGTTTDHGSAEFTITAVDQNGCSGSNDYSVSVDCPSLSITPSSLPNATMGTAYSATLGASGGGTPYSFAVSDGALPAGLTLSTAGAITGTPTGTGTENFTVTVTDGAGCTTSQLYSISSATGCDTISVTPETLPNGTAGTVYPQTMLAASGGTAPYTFLISAGALPDGLNLGLDGTLSGTPTAAGPFTFTVGVDDCLGCTGSRSYMITIAMACPAITFMPATLPKGTIGTAYSSKIIPAGGTAPYHITADMLPAGLTLDPGTGALTGTPTTAGTTMFTVTATDANSCMGTQAYSIQVSSVCPAITITPSALPGGVAGTNYSQPLSASGGTAPYAYAVLSGSLPGVTLSSSGLFTGIPTTEGTFQLAVTVTDSNHCSGGATYSASICAAITLTPTQLADATRGVPYTGEVFAGGGDTPYTYSVTDGALPAGLSLDSAGNLTGTPTTAGDFSFTVSVVDDLACRGSQAYAITVTTPSCPSLSLGPDSLPDATVDVAYSQSFSASGGQTPYTYGVRTGSLPDGLTLADGGALTGTPTTAGHFNFTIGATDTNSCSTARAYAITVVAACGVLTVGPSTLPNATAGTAYDQMLTATGGTAPYAFTVSAGLLPDGLELAASGELTGTATAAGSSGFSVTVTDADGCTGNGTYSFTVASPGCDNISISPLALLDGVIGSSYSQTFTATGGTAPYTWTTSGTLPAGLTMSTGGTLSGTPTAAGSESFAAVAHDSASCQATRQYMIEIACAPSGCPLPDAGPIDAPPLPPDAAPVPPDAAVIPPDASLPDAALAPPVDAETESGDAGKAKSSGGCEVGAGGEGGAGGAAILVGLGLVLTCRRRRRR